MNIGYEDYKEYNKIEDFIDIPIIKDIPVINNIPPFNLLSNLLGGSNSFSSLRV